MMPLCVPACCRAQQTSKVAGSVVAFVVLQLINTTVICQTLKLEDLH